MSEIVTDKQVEEMQLKIMDWAGDDFEGHDWAELLAEIVTGGYTPEEFTKDVNQYAKELTLREES